MSNDILKRHPQTLVDRLRPDGTVRAFSVDEQWSQVDHWYQFLKEADADPEYDGMNSLLEAWDALEPIHVGVGWMKPDRGEELRNQSDAPLSALFSFIEMGMYPPPELLLALLDCWDVYMHNQGTTSLEVAFLGKPIQKAGPYAQRTKARRAKSFMQLCFAMEVRKGKTRDEAAAVVSEMTGGRVDVDYVKRLVRMPKLPKERQK